MRNIIDADKKAMDRVSNLAEPIEKRVLYWSVVLLLTFRLFTKFHN